MACGVKIRIANPRTKSLVTGQTLYERGSDLCRNVLQVVKMLRADEKNDKCMGDKRSSKVFFNLEHLDFAFFFFPVASKINVNFPNYLAYNKKKSHRFNSL